MACSTTKVFERIADYRQWRQQLGGGTARSESIALVPTMGALHEGHAMLMRKARQECAHVVVSIFVNPLQFGPNEDYQRYPRTFPKDLEICAAEGVDVVLHPPVEEVYPTPGEATRVVPPQRLVNRLCGIVRPGHFEGVATVVMKLFCITEPMVAYFGEKDYQQLTVIKQLVRDLNVNVSIEGVPTVREPDGLALSSRNIYLRQEQRKLAPELHAVISSIKDDLLSGSTSVAQAVARGKQRLAGQGFAVQYLEVVDAETLSELTDPAVPFTVLVAAKLGDVRLIDNVIARTL